VALQVVSTFGLVRALHRGQVGIERGLGVHHDLAPFRHAHDHVRTLRALAGLQGFLFDEVAVLDHAGQFHQAAQGQFTPLAAHLRTAQCLHQVAGFVLQLPVRFRHGFEVPGQGAMRLLTLGLHAAYLLFGFFQCLANRPDQAFHGLFPAGEFTLRLDVKLLEVFPGQAQELRIIALQRLGGEGVEAVAQLGVELLQGLLLRAGVPALQVEFDGQSAAVGTRAGKPAGEHQEGRECTEHGGGSQGRNQDREKCCGHGMRS